MQNSMILEVAAGIVTFLSIAFFVAYQVVHFNKHLGDNMNTK